MLEEGDYVFVYRLQLAANVSEASNEIENYQFKRLLWRKPGPWKVPSVQFPAERVEEVGKPSDVSINRLILSPASTQMTNTPYRMMQTTQLGLENQQQHNTL